MINIRNLTVLALILGVSLA
jgi:hypothetical protein